MRPPQAAVTELDGNGGGAGAPPFLTAWPRKLAQTAGRRRRSLSRSGLTTQQGWPGWAFASGSCGDRKNTRFRYLRDGDLAAA